MLLFLFLLMSLVCCFWVSSVVLFVLFCRHLLANEIILRYTCHMCLADGLKVHLLLVVLLLLLLLLLLLSLLFFNVLLAVL